MSGLVDTWTCEMTRLREKGQPIGPTSDDSATGLGPICAGLSEHRGGSPTKLLAQIKRGYNQLFPNKLGSYSEASVSMLVDCFSP